MDNARADRYLTILANLAVLAGLAFLAIEVRQNTHAVRAAAVQNATEVARDQIFMFVQDADIVRLSMADRESLTAEDRRRRFWMGRSFWIGMQGLFRQFRLGTLPDEEWETWERVICSNYLNAGPEVWSTHSPTLADDFVELVEACSEITPGTLPN